MSFNTQLIRQIKDERKIEEYLEFLGTQYSRTLVLYMLLTKYEFEHSKKYYEPKYDYYGNPSLVYFNYGPFNYTTDATGT